MTLRALSCLRPTGAALGMRWLILVMIMFGTVISSMGLTNSHGLAAIAATHHLAPSSSDESHGHAHGNPGDEFEAVDASASADHPHHHALDHSHDTPHALPVAWSSAVPQLPSWRVLVRPWIEMVQASRLERPPMG